MVTKHNKRTRSHAVWNALARALTPPTMAVYGKAVLARVWRRIFDFQVRQPRFRKPTVQGVLGLTNPQALRIAPHRAFEKYSVMSPQWMEEQTGQLPRTLPPCTPTEP